MLAFASKASLADGGFRANKSGGRRDFPATSWMAFATESCAGGSLSALPPSPPSWVTCACLHLLPGEAHKEPRSRLLGKMRARPPPGGALGRTPPAHPCLDGGPRERSASWEPPGGQVFHIFLIVLLLDISESSSNPSDDEQKIFQYIDYHQDTFVQSLSKWVAVESDSIQPHLRENITEIINIAADSLRALGATVELRNVNAQEPYGQNLPLPPVILAELGNDTEKATVCFYGHLDVMPAKKEDGWETDPYTLTEIDGKLYGRGTTDNKGPVLAWINAVGTFIALNMAMPVNIKFLLEGMEEAGSLGLEDLLKEEEKGFFSNVAYIVISDNIWLSNKKPALTYGTRGNAGFFVEVECCKKDLHSGSFGGIVHEAMSDLVALLDSLVDSSGHIMIPGIYEDVANITEEEMQLYAPIEFNFDEHKANIGVKEFLYKTKDDILLNLWRNPSLSLHGIEGAFSEPGIKTVIPSKVIGKFSIRQVPNMNLTTVESQVKEHLKSVFAKRNSPNKLTVSMQVGAMPWIANIKDPQYEAARRAIKTVFQQDPDMIRDGSTIPVAKMFEDITKKSVMMFPIGAADDGEHSQNEKINRLNYISGTKVFASFLLEISKFHGASNQMTST